jgi:predicted nucleotidyltransferase
LLDVLISNKTRVKLLFRFFMNPGEAAYLRGLEKEFNDSTNAIRIELNRFEEAGILNASKSGNKKMYVVNTAFPLFTELQSLAMKHFGVDRILDDVISRLGEPQAVYLTGKLARGLDTPIIDLAIVADHIDRPYLARLVEKAEKTINRKIRTMVVSAAEMDQIPLPIVLIYGTEMERV